MAAVNEPRRSPERYDPSFRPRSGWAEGLGLWILPVPMALRAVGSLIVGSVSGVLTYVLITLLLAAGAALTRSGLAAAREFERKTVARAPRLPRKLLGATAIGLATALLAIELRYAPAAGLIFGVGAALGVLLLYGLDPRGEKAPGNLAGITTEAFARAIEEANGRLARLEATRKAIRIPAIQQKLGQMIARARGVVETIEREPASLPRARKFLNLYLDDAETVTRRFAAIEATARDPELERKFLESLETMDRVFAEQQDRLIRGSALDLDVQLEVLTQRLKQEGVV